MPFKSHSGSSKYKLKIYENERANAQAKLRVRLRRPFVKRTARVHQITVQTLQTVLLFNAALHNTKLQVTTFSGKLTGNLDKQLVFYRPDRRYFL